MYKGMYKGIQSLIRLGELRTGKILLTKLGNGSKRIRTTTLSMERLLPFPTEPT